MARAPRPINVRFFALLREQAGTASADVSSSAATPAELYTELQARFPGLTFPLDRLRVSVNERYVAPDHALAAGDRVVFIPPIAGG